MWSFDCSNKLGFHEKDKNDMLSQFISRAVEKGNLEKAKDMILYKMELGFGPQESLSEVYHRNIHLTT